MEKSKVQFKVPSFEQRKKALGAMGGTNFKVKKSLENVDKCWQPKVPPEPHDWLDEQFESGQSFDEFKVGKHATLQEDSSDTICILPLDKSMSKKFLQQIRSMCKAYFYGCNVKILDAISIGDIEKIDTRVLKDDRDTPVPAVFQYNGSQILSWVYRVYKPLNPQAICILAITTQDLYPEENETFVFGLANIMTQVGIFSFLRYQPGFNGDEVSSKEEGENMILYRACKVMTHEIGHMFGLQHCIYYECGMNGSNHIKECESRPLYYCVVCLRKLQYAIGFDIQERYKAVIKECEEFGGLFARDNEWFKQRLLDIDETFQKLQSKTSSYCKK